MPITTYYEIYPAIGIARLGPSDEYFFAPEPDCPDQLFFAEKNPVAKSARTQPPASFRDNTPERRLKRQAARFRVFECERDETMTLRSAHEVREQDARIEWKVHLANIKAASLTFDGSENRNAIIKGAKREKLKIDPVAKIVTATAPGLEPIKAFFNESIEVTLGDAWVAQNRLHVLGGKGNSGYDPQLRHPDELDFADNDGWYDDTSDGLITAHIQVKNAQGAWVDVAEEFVVPAWLIVGPFDFAPELSSYLTLYDVARQAALDKGLPEGVKYPSSDSDTAFDRDILPVLQRVRDYRWVNGGGMRAETQDRHTRWTGDLVAQLADPGHPKGRHWRRVLLAHLQEPPTLPEELKSNPPPREVYMPRLYGHDPDLEDGEHSPQNVLPLTPLQYMHFRNWAQDNFVPTGPEEEFLCEALTRVALEACSGGAFYPGMETPRIIRGMVQNAGGVDVYHDIFPLRIDWTKVRPGEITAGLALPWQADFYECAMGRDNAWWPVTRPDHALIGQPRRPVDSMSEEMYVWSECIRSPENMVDFWNQLGVVRRERVPDDKVPTDPAALKEFRSSNYDEVKEGDVTGYYYFRETERTLPAHKQKSSGY